MITNDDVQKMYNDLIDTVRSKYGHIGHIEVDAQQHGCRLVVHFGDYVTPHGQYCPPLPNIANNPLAQKEVEAKSDKVAEHADEHITEKSTNTIDMSFLKDKDFSGPTIDIVRKWFTDKHVSSLKDLRAVYHHDIDFRWCIVSCSLLSIPSENYCRFAPNVVYLFESREQNTDMFAYRDDNNDWFYLSENTLAHSILVFPLCIASVGR